MNNPLHREIKQLVLRMLNRADPQPLTDESLRAGISAVYPTVAFTFEQITALIKQLETAGIITSTDDAVFGTMWNLTVQGKNSTKNLK